MIKYLFLIAALLVLIFAENFLMVLGWFSVALIAVQILYNRLSLPELLLMLIPLSIALDSYNGFFIGTVFLALLSSVLALHLLKQLISSHHLLVEGGLALIAFLIFHLMLFILAAIEAGSPLLTLSTALISLRMAICEVFIYSLIVMILGSLAEKNEKSLTLKVLSSI